MMDCYQKELKKRLNKLEYGNFPGYYKFRTLHSNGLDSWCGEIEHDSRLGKCKKEWLKDKVVLDIGCNTGQLTLYISKLFEPKSILGIDIDSNLIDIAQRRLSDSRTSLNVSFVTQDFMLNSFDLTNFDCIICLSVTKWVHLNGGDDAVKALFKKIYKCLNNDGILILEAQPINSYRKKRLTPRLKANSHNIKFYPNQFDDYLLSSQVGFRCIKETFRDVEKVCGFDRETKVFVK